MILWVEDDDKYHGHVPGQTMRRPSALSMKEVTSHLVHFVGAVSLQDGDSVEELLVKWAVSSPHTPRQCAVAVRLAQPSCVLEVQQEAIAKYASEVLPQVECCEIILNLCVPKRA